MKVARLHKSRGGATSLVEARYDHRDAREGSLKALAPLPSMPKYYRIAHDYRSHGFLSFRTLQCTAAS